MMTQYSLYRYGALPIHVAAGVVCLSLLLVAWLFGFMPLMANAQQSTSVIAQAEQAEFDAKLAKGELDRLTKDVESVVAKLAAQPVHLRSADEINPLFAELAQWAEALSITITQTKARKAEALTYYDYIPIQLAGEGSFTDVLTFYKQIYAERVDMGVVSFSINRQPTGSGVGFELELAWYVKSHANESEDESQQQAAVVPAS